MSNKAVVISWDMVEKIGWTGLVDGEHKLVIKGDIPADCVVLFINKAEWPSIKKQAGL